MRNFRYIYVNCFHRVGFLAENSETKRLENEVASLKKDHMTPPQHVIQVQRQILPAPPSKPSPQKIIQDSNNNQMESKNLQTVSIVNGGQQTKEPNKKRSRIIQKTMKTLSTTKNNFKGSSLQR